MASRSFALLCFLLAATGFALKDMPKKDAADPAALAARAAEQAEREKRIAEAMEARKHDEARKQQALAARAAAEAASADRIKKAIEKRNSEDKHPETKRLAQEEEKPKDPAEELKVLKPVLQKAKQTLADREASYQANMEKAAEKAAALNQAKDLQQAHVSKVHTTEDQINAEIKKSDDARAKLEAKLQALQAKKEKLVKEEAALAAREQALREKQKAAKVKEMQAEHNQHLKIREVSGPLQQKKIEVAHERRKRGEEERQARIAAAKAARASREGK